MIGYLCGSVISGQRNAMSCWCLMRRAKRASFVSVKSASLDSFVYKTLKDKQNNINNAFIESYAMGDMFWPCDRRNSARALYIS